jgi:hypothetical protein
MSSYPVNMKKKLQSGLSEPLELSWAIGLILLKGKFIIENCNGRLKQDF